MDSERLEVFRIRPVGKDEGRLLADAVGGPYTIKADIYKWGIFSGRLLLTDEEPREIIRTSAAGFVLERGSYDF